MYAESLAYFLARYLERVDEVKGADMMLAVPLSEKRMIERGYNQSELIARSVAYRLGIEYGEDILIRVRSTSRQSTLSSMERRQNVVGAFGCMQAVEGKRIVLVDDIFTTGSTVESCAGALIRAGAEKVIAATVAVAAADAKSEDLLYRIRSVRTQ